MAERWTLWGYRVGPWGQYFPEGIQPIKLAIGDKRHVNAAQQRRKEEGWGTGVYPFGEPPTGLRMKFEEERARKKEEA